ncbi:peptidoglycan DD-metalloendopeptidase family protein, partial [Nocardia fluminea]|uniref:peptidoglycan DD-metalloendopeptidase family protein n=1 Tax=Nocardia fluminea TaxID=134984 RepID=UPI00366BE548
MTTRPVHSTFRVSSGFRTPERPDHDGIDIAAPVGTPIFAPVDGVIVEGAERLAGSVSGFGNWVWLDAQGNHGVDLIFGHMRHASILVKQGDRVREGEQIASVGSEGQATGPHLHFEVWGPPGRIGGEPRNPQDFLQGALDPGTQPSPDLDGSDPQAFPLPRGFFYGPLEGPASSISGRHGSERPEWIAGLKRWQQARGLPQTGVYDQATADAARTVQFANGLTPDGLIGPSTWRAGFTSVSPGERPSRLQLVDHAAARPGAQAVKADGYHGAVRYLVDSPERGLINKKLTPEEAAGYLGLEMPLVSNWQKGKNATADWRRGFDGGVADAEAADAWHRHSCRPAHSPIFISNYHDTTLSE